MEEESKPVKDAYDSPGERDTSTNNASTNRSTARHQSIDVQPLSLFYGMNYHYCANDRAG